MKLYFSHEMGFGKMEHETLLYFPFAASFEKNEHNHALNNGWFPLNKEMWYQCRSTRLDLTEYKPSKKIIALSKKIKYYPDLNLNETKKNKLSEIYKKYIKYKGFGELSLTIDDMIANSHGYVYYAYENNIIGFSFYKIISGNFLSVEFAWDYENPKLSLGHVSIYMESLLARKYRCKKMYLGAGYEKCSLYKADYPGFEWWKGYEWSKDTEKYKSLCLRDQNVKILNFEDM
jgi:hypothetical protein